MTATSFCTVTASTKRNSDLGGGNYGPPAAYLATLAVTPLWPVSRETVQRLALNSPRRVLECYHVPTGSTLPDVQAGDVLVVAGTEYPITYAGQWTDGSVPSLHLLVDEIQGT